MTGIAGDILPLLVMQPVEQELASSKAVSLVKRGSTTAKAAFSQAVSLSLENRCVFPPTN